MVLRKSRTGRGRLAAAAALLAIVSAAPALACAANVQPVTFDVNVAMRMRTFPWITLHMLGVGRYEPGEFFTVRFTKVPWFVPPQRHIVDLSMLDPTMWPDRYSYRWIGQENGLNLFALQYIQYPTMMHAVVGLDAAQCAREVDVTYSDGTTIDMHVEFGSVQGFMLPTSLTASISVPHASFMARARFSNYALSPLSGPTASIGDLSGKR